MLPQCLIIGGDISIFGTPIIATNSDFINSNNGNNNGVTMANVGHYSRPNLSETYRAAIIEQAVNIQHSLNILSSLVDIQGTTSIQLSVGEDLITKPQDTQTDQLVEESVDAQNAPILSNIPAITSNDNKQQELPMWMSCTSDVISTYTQQCRH